MLSMARRGRDSHASLNMAARCCRATLRLWRTSHASLHMTARWNAIVAGTWARKSRIAAHTASIMDRRNVIHTQQASHAPLHTVLRTSRFNARWNDIEAVNRTRMSRNAAHTASIMDRRNVIHMQHAPVTYRCTALL